MNHSTWAVAIKHERDVLGTPIYSFKAEGLPPYANEVGVWREYDVQTISRLIHAAYEQGRADKAEELRHCLGIVVRI